MKTEEEIQTYYRQIYKCKLEGKSISINRNLWIDFKTICLRKSKNGKNISASAQIRELMIKFILENKDDLL